MQTLEQSITSWLGRVQLVARGLEETRRQASEALRDDEPVVARGLAAELVRKAPDNPVGLALLTDSCERLWLHEQATEALQRLCEIAPWRGELWLRLAQSVQRTLETGKTTDAQVEVYLHKALETKPGEKVRTQALLMLAEIDLRANNGMRALRWFDAATGAGGSDDNEDADISVTSVGYRARVGRLESALQQGDLQRIKTALGAFSQAQVLDGRGQLAIGRARTITGDEGAVQPLCRAFLLEVPGAREAMATYITRCDRKQDRTELRAFLRATDSLQDPVFSLAFALAEGDRVRAQRLVRTIADSGNEAAAWQLYDIALETQDWDALTRVVQLVGNRAPSSSAALMNARALYCNGLFSQAIDALDGIGVGATPAGEMAHQLRIDSFFAQLDSTDNHAHFSSILEQLRKAAGNSDRLDLIKVCDQLTLQMDHPLRVAVMGEFNAGKSTFINALLGADVAPTGVLPTTASLHWLRWAPDCFARIVLRSEADRVVRHDALKQVLDELRTQGSQVSQVQICAPIDRLRHIEILDTPGFNATQTDHDDIAKQAIEHAHVVLWLVDGCQPLKDSERRRLQEIVSAGIPLQVLVNKCDRIGAEGLNEVRDHLRRALDDEGVRCIAPLVLMSAREALRWTIEQPSAQAPSHWQAVEALLSEHIVNRRVHWQHRAVMRGMLRVVTDLLRDREKAQSGEGNIENTVNQSDNVGKQTEQQKQMQQMQLFEQFDKTSAARVMMQLEQPLEQLAQDLRPLELASTLAQHDDARAYGEARVLALMTPHITKAFINVIGLDPLLESTAHETIAAVLRGATATCSDARKLDTILSPRLMIACASAIRDRLLSRTDQTMDTVDPVGLRLAALRVALESKMGYKTTDCEIPQKAYRPNESNGRIE